MIMVSDNTGQWSCLENGGYS